LLGIFCHLDVSLAIKCELFSPLEDSQDGPEMGLIFIPGAQIRGEMYGLLAQELQAQFPGKLWIGLTEDWWVTMPNPIQIGPAINACFDEAESAGYNMNSVFLGGHSLGGVVLESYISNHMKDNIMGLILFGSYLPDLPSTNNTFPVPVLSAVGTLDGLTLSIAFREYQESQKYNETRHDDPVLLVDDVNHGQVASGDLPSHVLIHDIDPVIELEDAHARYADTAVTFMVTTKTTRNQFSKEVVEEANDRYRDIEEFTRGFFLPFERMLIQEDMELANGLRTSPWMTTGQMTLLGAYDYDDGPNLSELTVATELVSASEIGGVKPDIMDSPVPCESVRVTTYSHNRHYGGFTDHDSLVSTEVMKAKFRIADDVLKHLCIDYDKRWQCKDINENAFQLARSVSSAKALERYDRDGIKFIFTDDHQTPWGPGWLYDRGLEYNKVNETHTNVTSTSLISPVAFKTHYCDLMTPYRALEWIYIGGVKHGKTD